MFLFQNASSRLKRIGMNMVVYGIIGVALLFFLTVPLNNIVATEILFTFAMLTSNVFIIGGIISIVAFFRDEFSPKKWKPSDITLSAGLKAYNCISVSQPSATQVPYLPDNSPVLNLIEVWRNGTQESLFVIQKSKDLYTLFEIPLKFIFPNNPPDKYLIMNTDSMDLIVQDLSDYFSGKYNRMLEFDFGILCTHKEAFNYFGFS